MITLCYYFLLFAFASCAAVLSASASPILSEFLASNDDGLTTAAGDNEDWIEIRNTASEAVSLAGYHLTDDPEQPTRWALPAVDIEADGFLLVFASGDDLSDPEGELHTDFRLARDGGYLALTASSGSVASSFEDYPPQRADISYGLAGSDAVSVYFGDPTPGEANASTGWLGFVSDTRFSIDRGYYADPVEVEITTETEGATILYTRDGSVPAAGGGGEDANGDTYEGPITIDTTTTLRAVAVKDDYRPTNVDTHTYLFLTDVIRQTGDHLPQDWDGEPADYEMDSRVVDDAKYKDTIIEDFKTLPSLSITMEPDDFFSTDEGIYPGKIGEDGIDKACSAELLHPDGNEGFQIDCAIRIVGQTSPRRWKIKKLSMRLRFDGDYGPGMLRYPIYDEPLAAEEFNTLTVDARHNNTWAYQGGSEPTKQRRRAQYLRDQTAADLHRAMGGLSPHGRYVHTFVNGVYWGMYNLHERPDDAFNTSYQGGERKDWVCLRHGSAVISGSRAPYVALHELSESAGTAEGYAEIEGILDIDDFISYLLVNFGLGNRDWGPKNYYVSRNPYVSDAKWRYHSWDAEKVFQRLNDDITNRNDSKGPTGLHQNLMDNDDYLIRFADHVYKQFYNDGVMSVTGLQSAYKRRTDEIDRAIILESARWGDAAKGVDEPYTKEDWDEHRDWIMNDYFPDRVGIAIEQFEEAGLFGDLDPPAFEDHGGYFDPGYTVTINKSTGGHGDIYYTTDGTDPRLPGGDLAGDAIDYSEPFVLNETTKVRARVYDLGLFGDKEWSALLEATFVIGAVPPTSENLVINMINYNPASATDAEELAGFSRSDFEFIALTNISDQTVRLADLQFLDGIRFDFANANVTKIRADQNVFLVKNRLAFEDRYGVGFDIAGQYSGSLSNGGERLLLEAGEDTVADFAYNDNSQWPQGTDGDGAYLIVADPDSKPDQSQPGSWRASSADDSPRSVAGAPPSGLAYSANPATYTKGAAIAENMPSSTGGAVDGYSIAPALPEGLSLGLESGVISGTPSELSTAADYTVTATNSAGTATATVSITVNDAAPSELAYSANSAVYTKGVVIAENGPSSSGGAVLAYTIAPALPAGLSLDSESGVISGTPSALSSATDYTVRASNSGGSTTATVNITVNDAAPSELGYSANSVVYTKGVAIAENRPSSSGGAVLAYTIEPALPAGLSLDPESGVISGTPSALSSATEYTVRASNSGGSTTATVNIAVNDAAPSELGYSANSAVYTKAVAIAENKPSSSGGAVLAYTIAPALPAGLSLDPESGVISGTPSALSSATEYTVRASNSGGSTTATVSLAVNDAAPSELGYSANSAVYTKGVAIAENGPSSSGGAVLAYTIAAALPAGLSLDPESGVISGTPSALSSATEYTVRASNSGGSTTATVNIAVNDAAPSELGYSDRAVVYTKGVAIAENRPSSSGGAVLAYTIAPALPAGLSLDPESGVISGTPSALSSATDYTVRASNSGGSTTATVNIAVNDAAPSELGYFANSAVYTKGVAIAENRPSSSGGAVLAYTIAPALPAGLSLDPESGVISGTPSALSSATDYTVRASNSGGSTTATVSITVNDAAPSELAYSANWAVYTKGVAIAENKPSSSGGAVLAYTIAPALPAGLSLDLESGVISGTPSALSSATEYTVRASNSGGSTTATVNIAVNDAAPSELGYFANSVVYTKGVAIAENRPSSSGGAVLAYAIAPALPAGLSLDSESGVISGTPSALSSATDYTVRASNSGGSTTATVSLAVNDAAPSELAYSANSAVYTKGVVIAENGPSSSGGAVLAYTIAPALPAGLSLDSESGVISGTPSALSSATEYTVRASNSGGSTTATVNIAVNDAAPSELAYSANSAVYTKGIAIAENGPSSSGGAVLAYTIAPALPAGLSLDPESGVISGTPSALSSATDYTVRASNSGGSTTATVNIAVNDAAPSELAYSANSAVYTKGIAIAENGPSSSGGAVLAYTIAPALPAGLSLDPESGVISGTPSALSSATDYTVRASNSGGSTTATVNITVNDAAPSELGYFANSAVYTKGVAIAENRPSSSGGAVLAYAIAPALPAGLSLDSESGVILGTPSALSSATDYTVRASNSGGSTTATVSIAVNDAAPSELAYSANSAVYTKGVVIAENGPSSSGGAVLAYTIAPALPAGLSLDPESGVISGTPSALSSATDYTVRASNSGGSTTATVSIAVNDAAPSELAYSANSAVYTKGAVIAENKPSSSGGAVLAYTIAPALPAGLSLDLESGVISGTPSALSSATEYTVRASNSGGSTTATVNIAVNDVAPSELGYSANSVVYTKGVAIAGNRPSSSGGAVLAYTIVPALPAGLSLDPESGVISGTPSALSTATEYTVRASNSGGSTAATVSITVSDAAPSELAYSAISVVYTRGVAIAENRPSSAGVAVLAYSIAPALPAGLSLDPDSGVISGTPSELSTATDYTVRASTSGGSTTATLRIAVNDVAPSELTYSAHPAIYTKGVAIAETPPSSTGGAVVAYDIVPALPAGLNLDPDSGVISGTPSELRTDTAYTVTATNTGGSTTAEVSITVIDVAPSELIYAANPAIYIVGVVIAKNMPSLVGGAVVAYSVAPALPAGLSLDGHSGVISGVPSALSGDREYTVTAANSGGSTTATVRIIVIDVAPSELTYSSNPAVYTVGVAVAETPPSSRGGAVVAFSIAPALPAGLSFHTDSGVISGTPSEPSAATEYTVTAANLGGSTMATVSITVKDVAPRELTYSANPAIYTKGVAVAENTPSSTGGAVVAYSIAPALPAGLILDPGSGVISGTPAERSAETPYTVTATNSGGSTAATVMITVEGRKPRYTESGPFNLAENSAEGTPAGDVDANDADGGAGDEGITYAIQSGNDDVDGDATPAFALDPDTGVLTVRDQDDLDQETRSSFTLVIRATDEDGFADVEVIIRIDGVPEAPVTTGLNPVHVMIGAPDRVIHLAAAFSDEEDADLSYSIRSNSNSALLASTEIDEETDRLTLDFAPNSTGTATLEIAATDSDGQSVSATLVVTVSGDLTQEWRSTNFTAADLAEPAKEATVWGSAANPDGDLWSNALEFFFGTDPNGFDVGHPITYEIQKVDLETVAVLEFERSKAVPAGLGVVEGSGDLSAWQAVSAPAVVVEDLGDRERVQVSMPLKHEQTRQHFIRLVIDL